MAFNLSCTCIVEPLVSLEDPFKENASYLIVKKLSAGLFDKTEIPIISMRNSHLNLIWNWGISLDIPRFSRGLVGHMTRLDQSHAREIIGWGYEMWCLSSQVPTFTSSLGDDQIQLVAIVKEQLFLTSGSIPSRGPTPTKSAEGRARTVCKVWLRPNSKSLSL